MKKNLAFGLLCISAIGLTSQNEIGINVSNIDRSIDPKTDFYQFANGTWLKNNTIPASEPAYGSFNEIMDRNNIDYVLNNRINIKFFFVISIRFVEH